MTDVVTLDLAMFLVATFAAALVAGLAGFAFGLVAAAVWLYIITPLQTASLIIAFGLIVQGVAVWKLRHALRWSRLWPFLAGAAIGVPVGVAILGWANPDAMRASVGVLLVLYSIYGLTRPAISGKGQSVLSTAHELDAVLENFPAEALATFGLVLEGNLRHVSILSVGRIALEEQAISYHGTRYTVPRRIERAKARD